MDGNRGRARTVGRWRFGFQRSPEVRQPQQAILNEATKTFRAINVGHIPVDHAQS